MSRPGISEYVRPADLEAAWARIADNDPSVRLLSGGTDLTISAPAGVETLVDLAGCLGDEVEADDDGTLRIGAMTTLTDMLESPDLADHASGVIPEMLADVGNPLLRNISTIGGHLARGKLSDVIPVMVALDAEVVIYDGESRQLPISRYYDEDLHRAPHLLTDLILPPLGRSAAAAFLRFARTSFDFPMLNVCCRASRDGPMVTDVRVVCGATPIRSQRAVGAESWIREHGLGVKAIETAAKRAGEEIVTRAGWVASAEYRTQLAEVLTERCLTEVARRLGIS